MNSANKFGLVGVFTGEAGEVDVEHVVTITMTGFVRFSRKVHRDREFGSDGQGLAVQRGGAHARRRRARGRRDQRESEPGRSVRGEHERGRRHIPVALPARRRRRAARQPVQREQRQSARTAGGPFEAAVAEEDVAGPEGEHQGHIECAKGPDVRRTNRGPRDVIRRWGRPLHGGRRPRVGEMSVPERVVDVRLLRRRVQ